MTDETEMKCWNCGKSDRKNCDICKGSGKIMVSRDTVNIDNEASKSPRLQPKGEYIEGHWNLSEKICNESISEGEDLNIIYAEDVREFIRRLKLIVKGDDSTDCDGKTYSENIDKLAGEKLI